MSTPVILELALNGSTPRSRNRHVPRTPAEIAEVALAGIELGASIVHNHNDEPMFTVDGAHSAEPYLAAWRPILSLVRSGGRIVTDRRLPRQGAASIQRDHCSA